MKKALRAAQAAGVAVQIKIKDGEMTVTVLDKAAPATMAPGDDHNDADVKALEEAIKNDDGKY